ncbi:hypothetical protein J2X72_001406 [Phyllobacterium sp. 1468]|nr:hypothetical protein [Phyllobacterium sp. 1468]
MSETMNQRQVPETTILHRSLWAGRIMSALVIIALVADGTIQLFAPAQIASMLQETGFAMDLTRIVGPIILACAILYAIPATAVLGAILVTGFLGGAICAHVRIGELGSPPEIISLLLGAMTWAAFICVTLESGPFYRSSIEPSGAVLCPSTSGENACF